MSDTTGQATPYSNRAEILAELWMNYRIDPEFRDFIEYNDMGLPLSYFITENVVESTPIAENFINETFEILLKSLEIPDEGFDSLDDILELKEAKEEE
jgi:hypothetical protein